MKESKKYSIRTSQEKDTWSAEIIRRASAKKPSFLKLKPALKQKQKRLNGLRKNLFYLPPSKASKTNDAGKNARKNESNSRYPAIKMLAKPFFRLSSWKRLKRTTYLAKNIATYQYY